MSDHIIVTATVNTKPKLHPKVAHKVFAYKKANCDGLRQDTKVVVDTFLESNPAYNSVEDNWTQLLNHLQSCMKKHTHQKITKNKHNLDPLDNIWSKKTHAATRSLPHESSTTWYTKYQIRIPSHQQTSCQSHPHLLSSIPE